MNLLDRIKSRFVGHARQWYKMWSSWLAILQSIIVTVLWTEPTILGELVSVLPHETRVYLSPLVLGLVAALPIIVRLLKQQSLTK